MKVESCKCLVEVQNMEWMTVKEAGAIWGITTRRAQYLCSNGQVKNAQKLGSQWVIPKGTPKPVDGRTKAAKEEIAK
jgi:predicted DNA-binding ArsR family transcriptional regulator